MKELLQHYAEVKAKAEGVRIYSSPRPTMMFNQMDFDSNNVVRTERTFDREVSMHGGVEYQFFVKDESLACYKSQKEQLELEALLYGYWERSNLSDGSLDKINDFNQWLDSQLKKLEG